MSDKQPVDDGGQSAPDDSEWENRVLCSDGSCIGVIGPDGRCKECGKPFEGELPDQFSAAPAEEETEAISGESASPPPQLHPEDRTEESDEAPMAVDSSWEGRVLCSDGNCIGVIGPDGRCKECGKPYQPEPAGGEE